MGREVNFYPVEEATVSAVLNRFKSRPEDLVSNEFQFLISKSDYLLWMLLRQRDRLHQDETTAFTSVGLTTHHFLRMQSLFNRFALPAVNEIRSNLAKWDELQNFLKITASPRRFRDEQWFMALYKEEPYLHRGIVEISGNDVHNVCELNAASYVYYMFRGIDHINQQHLIQSLRGPYGHRIRI